MHVLLVEEETLLAEFVCDRLSEEGFEVHIARDLAQAEPLLVHSGAIILDIDGSANDNVAFLRRQRSKFPNLVMVVLSAKGDIAGCIQSLEAGADDCLSKPFSYAELSARIRAAFRQRAGQTQSKLVVDDLVLDRIERTVERGRRRIELTEKEFTLLEFLMQRPHQPVSRELINGQAWEFEPEKPTNLVAVYINYLRRKIDSGFERPLIRTVRGVGYQIGTHEAHPST